MNPKNPFQPPPGGFTDHDILKMLLALQQEQQQNMAAFQKKNKKHLSLEEYSRQAVINLLNKVGIESNEDDDDDSIQE